MTGSGSDLTLGVEEEFLLVDDAGQIAPAAALVLGNAPSTVGDLQPEMVTCQVESATPVCRDPGELLGHLRDLRAQLSGGVRRQGLRLLSTGTPPMAQAQPASLTPDPRYRRIAEHFRALMGTTNICGCHVHVGIADRAVGVRISNHLRPWLPVLLAMTANSPFAGGDDSGYASWRYLCMSIWPTAGPPPYFHSLEHYESTVERIAASGAVLDPAMLYWDVRLSARHPTVEVRVCDATATAEEAALIAALVRGLAQLARQRIADGCPDPRVPQEVLQASLWRAARDGLDGHCVDPLTEQLRPVPVVLHGLLGQLRPVLAGTDEETFVPSAVRRLLAAGGGAARQRAAYAQDGSMKDVLTMLARQTMGTTSHE